MEKFSVLNLPINLSDDYVGWLMERFKQKKGTQIVTLNSEMAMLAEQNTELAKLICEADLVIPDGAGVVMYLRLRGQKQQRCPGIELAESLLIQLGQLGEECLICFYGGKPDVVQQAAEGWREKVPGICLMANHGYLDAPEQEQWLKTIEDKQPKLILVGLGVPRQEFWIKENRHLSPQAIWIGVGGSFDIWSGKKTRAPSFLRDNNLEWFYRLYQEPWRWRRMLALPKFFWRVILFGKSS